MLAYMDLLKKLPQPFSGFILITTLVFVFMMLPMIVLEKMGAFPKGGEYHEEQRCDYYGTNC
jgi:hypothetical protein